MSATTSATTGRRYGLERVCRTWERSRSALYARRARVRRPERGAGPGRRGPTPALSDAQLLAAIRSDLVRSPFQGEGHPRGIHDIRVSRTRVLRVKCSDAAAIGSNPIASATTATPPPSLEQYHAVPLGLSCLSKSRRRTRGRRRVRRTIGARYPATVIPRTYVVK